MDSLILAVVLYCNSVELLCWLFVLVSFWLVVIFDVLKC